MSATEFRTETQLDWDPRDSMEPEVRRGLEKLEGILNEPAPEQDDVRGTNDRKNAIEAGISELVHDRVHMNDLEFVESLEEGIRDIEKRLLTHVIHHAGETSQEGSFGAYIETNTSGQRVRESMGRIHESVEDHRDDLLENPEMWGNGDSALNTSRALLFREELVQAITEADTAANYQTAPTGSHEILSERDLEAFVRDGDQDRAASEHVVREYAYFRLQDIQNELLRLDDAGETETADNLAKIMDRAIVNGTSHFVQECAQEGAEAGQSQALRNAMQTAERIAEVARHFPDRPAQT